MKNSFTFPGTFTITLGTITLGIIIRGGLLLLLCGNAFAQTGAGLATSGLNHFPASSVPAGIVGNGETDNTSALQNALDANRGPISLPAGKYLISKPLRIPSHSGITGAGTLVMQKDQPLLVCTVKNGGLTDIFIQGITLEKKWISQSEQPAVIIKNVSKFRFSGVNVSGICSVPVLDLYDCRQFSITDCYLHDCLNDLIVPHTPSGREVDLLGINLMRCSFGQVTGNRIENLQATPASLEAISCQTDGISPMLCKNLVITNNLIRNVGEGIDMRVCESCTVSNNVIENCYHFGIKVIHGSKLNTFANNSIRNASLAGFSLYFGMSRFGPNYGNVLTGNVITNTGAFPEDNKNWMQGWPRAGIEIVNDSKPDNPVHRNLITGNIIFDNQQTPTCKYGIIERSLTGKSHSTQKGLPAPHVDGNQIVNNLIYGMSVMNYKTGAETTPDK